MVKILVILLRQLDIKMHVQVQQDVLLEEANHLQPQMQLIWLKSHPQVMQLILVIYFLPVTIHVQVTLMVMEV